MENYKEKYEQALERQEDSANIVEYIFPELEESEDILTRKELTAFLKSASAGFLDATIQCSIFGKWLAWLEKQASSVLSNSLSIGKKEDKVEPKFKVGDWVLVEQVENIINGPFMIKEIGKYGYVLDGIRETVLPFTSEHCMHLWTIQDAKSGDVLYTPKGCGVEGIFLIEGWKQVDDTGRTLCSSIGYRVKDDEIVAGGLGAIWWKGVIDPFYPATKEQRDLLFQKMKGAGYEWDAEKKELKKLAESDDEKTRKEIMEYIKNTPAAPEGHIEQRVLSRWLAWLEKQGKDPIGYIHSIDKDGNYTIEPILSNSSNVGKDEQKPSWSEEDERILNGLISSLARIGANTRTDSTSINYTFTREIDWLKSLKSRLQ